jgi:hypothetical protein
MIMETNNAHEDNEETIKLITFGYKNQPKSVKATLRSVFKGNDKIIEKFDAIDVEEKE